MSQTASYSFNRVLVEDSANLDFTVDDDRFAQHDVGFDVENTMQVRIVNVGGGSTVCLNLTANESPHGFKFRNSHAGGTFNVQSAVNAAITADGSSATTNDANPANVRTELQNKGNTGGAGDPFAATPDVDVIEDGGQVALSTTACQTPSGGIFAVLPPVDVADAGPGTVADTRATLAVRGAEPMQPLERLIDAALRRAPELAYAAPTPSLALPRWCDSTPSLC